MSQLMVVSAVGGLLTGGLSYISATRKMNKQMKIVNQMAANNGGRIQTGGMTADGKMYDGFTTPEMVKKGYKKIRLVSTAMSAALGFGVSALLNYGIKFLSKVK